MPVPKSKFNLDSGWVWLITLLILALVANVAEIECLWGLNHLKFLPQSVTYIAFTAVGVTLIPVISRKSLLFAEKVQGAEKHKLSKFAIPVLVSLLLVFLGLAFPSATTYLGDGHLRTNQIRSGEMILFTEFLDFYLHSMLYKYVFEPRGLEPIQCYQVYSSICGFLYVVGVWRLSLLINGKRSLAVFFVLICSGSVALFVGYVESYASVMALLPFVIHAGFQALNVRNSIVTYVTLYVLACASHSMSIIVLTPSVLSVLVHRYSGRLFETKKWLTALLAFAVAGLGIGYLSPPIDGFDFSKYLLPILPGSNSSLSVVSIEHTASILNWLYFSALAFLFLAPRMIKKLVLRYTRNDALTAYSVSILAPALVFVLFFAPQLGSPRDWDLFSVVSFLMLVSGLLLTSDDDGPGAWTWTPPVIVLSLALSISFVTINSSINKSTSRFVEIIEIGRTGNLFKEYNLMSAYAADFPEIAERRFEFTEKAWREIPYTKRDSVLILNKLGEQLLSRGSPDSALSLINLSLTVDTSHLLTYHHLIKALRVGGKAERLYGLAETMSTRFQDDARGIMDAGILYAELGDTANSNKCIVLAYTLDSNDVFIMVNYGVNMLRSGKPNKAVGILEKSVQRFPDYFLANLNLSLAYATVRNVELAQYYLRAAEKLIANESEALQVSRLRTVIDRR